MKKHADPWGWLWWLIFLGLAIIALTEATAVYAFALQLLRLFE